MLKTLEPMVIQQQLLTGDELAQRVDLARGELVEGIFVKMPPPTPEHARIKARITVLLGIYLEQYDTGLLLSGEVGIFTKRDPDTVRAMDAAYISYERYAQWTDGTYLSVAPEIVVEVLSPTDRWSAVNDKIEEYFAIGVELIWIIDPRRREVTVFASPASGQRLTEKDSLTGGHILPHFNLPLQKLFRLGK